MREERKLVGCFHDLRRGAQRCSGVARQLGRRAGLGGEIAILGKELRRAALVSSRFIPCRCLLSRTTREELSKPYGAEIFTLVLAIGQVKKVSADTVLCLSDTNMRRGSTTDNCVCLVC